VKVEETQFEGQTKTKLGNVEVRPLVDTLLTEKLGEYFEENPAVAKLLIEKALAANRAREAAKKAREASRRKSPLESGSHPDKLADCQEKDPAKSEIFFVEGGIKLHVKSDKDDILSDNKSVYFIRRMVCEKLGKAVDNIVRDVCKAASSFAYIMKDSTNPEVAEAAADIVDLFGLNDEQDED
jgi:hypothetical protein